VSDDQSRGDEVGRYRIGTVSDLTGIPPHTLRAWERRYSAADPDRTQAGFRLYSEEDVGRLTLIKRLSGLGHAIGNVAGLSLPELQDRLARAEERAWRSSPFPPRGHAPGPTAVALLDPPLEAQIREAAGGEGEGLHLLLSADSLQELEFWLLERSAPVVVVAALPRMGSDPVESTCRILGMPCVSGILLLHDFVPRRILSRLGATGARLLRGRPEVASVTRWAREMAEGPSLPATPSRETGKANGNGNTKPLRGGEAPAAPPPRAFTDVELGRLREVETAVDCECPNHLAFIISSLVAFEEYCRECENRDARDAEIHAHLGRETGRARAVMDQALLFLCREEGIEL